MSADEARNQAVIASLKRQIADLAWAVAELNGEVAALRCPATDQEAPSDK
jgi:hypothetical protein